MGKIFEIASQVSTPLALAGFFAAVLFFVFRQIVAKNIFPRLTAAIGADLLRLIIDRLFVLALVAMLLGFAGYIVPKLFDHGPEPASRNESPTVNVDAVSYVVRSQLESHDYANAWDSVAKALQSAPARADLLDLQADVAMSWVRDVSLVKGQKFGDVVDRLVPVLYQTVQRHKDSDKVRAADALAHIGWANFLKRRDGVLHLDIDGKYREAVGIDPDNPFAHAMWGHWLIANGDHLAEAQAQFAAALKSGRERSFVRQWQLAALQWVTTDENTLELIRVCNEMRKNGEPLRDEDQRRRLLSQIYFMHRDAVLAHLDQVLPADEHLATYQWLLRGTDTSPPVYQTFFLARLSEAAGDCGTAQRLYASVPSASMMSQEVQDGIARCKRVSSLHP